MKKRFLTISSVRPRVAFITFATAMAALLVPDGTQAQQFTFSKIADTTTIAPGHGVFEGFSAPALSGRTVAFFAQYNGGSGVYTGSAGSGVAKVADTTDNAPGHGAFTSFPTDVTKSISVSGSTVAFLGYYSGGGGIYIGSAGTGLSTVVDGESPLPGHPGGTFSSFGDPSISGNTVAFKGEYPGLGSGIYTGRAGVGASKIADHDTIVPGHGTFGAFGRPSISGDNVGFWGGYDSGGGALYTASVQTGIAAAVVTIGDNAPGHGAFYNLSDPSISGNTIAFVGMFDSNSEGIYTGSTATGVTKVAETGDTAPGHGTFGSAGPASMSGSTVAFAGSYSNESGSGIFLKSGGSLFPVVSTGDVLFGSTVTGFLMGSSGCDSGSVAFEYFLTDGRTGIAVATPIASVRILSITRTAAGTTHLEVLGVPNVSHTIQASPDLVQPFTNIGTRTATSNGTFQFDDATSLLKRFYRVVLP